MIDVSIVSRHIIILINKNFYQVTRLENVTTITALFIYLNHVVLLYRWCSFPISRPFPAETISR